MITSLDIAHNVVGYRVDGKVEKDDVDRVFQDLDRRLEEKGRIRVYAEVDSFSGMSLDALWHDLRGGIKRWGEISKIDKAALVTDVEWLRKVAVVEDKVLAGVHVRVFSKEDQPQARLWVQS